MLLRSLMSRHECVDCAKAQLQAFAVAVLKLMGFSSLLRKVELKIVQERQI
jgi:hypothetical protein